MLSSAQMSKVPGLKRFESRPFELSQQLFSPTRALETLSPKVNTADGQAELQRSARIDDCRNEVEGLHRAGSGVYTTWISPRRACTPSLCTYDPQNTKGAAAG